MVRLQLASGMRPGELVIMRACDLNMSGAIWEYVPGTHKTEHHEGVRPRVIMIGPKGQEIIRPFLGLNMSGYLFSPASPRPSGMPGGAPSGRLPSGHPTSSTSRPRSASGPAGSPRGIAGTPTRTARPSRRRAMRRSLIPTFRQDPPGARFDRRAEGAISRGAGGRPIGGHPNSTPAHCGDDDPAAVSAPKRRRPFWAMPSCQPRKSTPRRAWKRLARSRGRSAD